MARTSKIEIRRGRPNARWGGQFHYVVIAANGEVLVTSETYPDKRACRDGINALGRALRSAEAPEIIDTTKPVRPTR